MVNLKMNDSNASKDSSCDTILNTAPFYIKLPGLDPDNNS